MTQVNELEFDMIYDEKKMDEHPAGVRRQVVDLGFCVAIIEPREHPDADLHGGIVLTILQPEAVDSPANCVSVWARSGDPENMIRLRDALSEAIADRTQELELGSKVMPGRGLTG